MQTLYKTYIDNKTYTYLKKEGYNVEMDIRQELALTTTQYKEIKRMGGHVMGATKYIKRGLNDDSNVIEKGVIKLKRKLAQKPVKNGKIYVEGFGRVS